MRKAVLFTLPKQDSCPQCGAALVIRSGRHGRYRQCAQYPQCDYRSILGSQSQHPIIKILHDQVCPFCRDKLVLRQGRYGMFISCIHYPECDHTESIDPPGETLVPCPQCSVGKLIQRCSRYGKYFYACDCYPTCQFILNTPPIKGCCCYCGFSLLTDKKTAQGQKRICASKNCAKSVPEQE